MTLYLDPIRARLAAATPGPWEVDECSDETTVIVAGSDLTIICSELWQGWEGTQDAALIANAPSDMAALVAEVERLWEAVQRVRVLIEDWQANGNSRELGDPTAHVWHMAASQALRALDGAS